jgi:hypothetical protein
MIKYTIISKNDSSYIPKSAIQQADPGTKEGRAVILYRLLVRHKSRFPINKRIKLKGSSKRGKVTDVFTDPDKALWDTNSPRFVEVLLDDGTSIVVNPRDLKTKGG